MASVQKFTAAFAFALVMGTASAFATPYVDIRSGWSISARAVPDGVSFSCGGSASGSGGYCYGGVSLNTAVTGSQSFAVSTSGNIVVTNTTDHALTGFLALITNFSSFNPGGSGIGIAIDDPITQAGRFTSSVSGPGVGDFHSCAVGKLGQSGAVYSPTACGVFSPDSSQGYAIIDLSMLAPQASTSLSYSAAITADFVVDAVPEAPSLLLLMTALLGFARPLSRRS